MLDKKANLFDSIPEELQDLQLTDEEIGMIYSGAGSKANPACPWCHQCFASNFELARHMPACEKKPEKQSAPRFGRLFDGNPGKSGIKA